MTDYPNNQDSSSVLAGIVILAGGASKRMGSPKAQLTLPSNETLLDYHVQHSIMLNVPIMIADNKRGFIVDATLLSTNPNLPIVHIADYGATNTSYPQNTGGALVAIESALKTLAISSAMTIDSSTLKPKSWLMVISCDSLIPAGELWQHLQLYIAHAANKTVICLTDDAHLYPLLGIYRLNVEPNLRAYIDQGERRVVRFIEPLMHAVSIPNRWQHLTNFNTPNEFKRACTALYQL